jgi:dihydropteroate synthase
MTKRPLVMGVINVTPDSFSDGGFLANSAATAGRAADMAVEGADWLDVGGESTRPGAAAIAETEELARVMPAIAAIRARCDLPISVDTMKPAVARAAVAAGATMWNDVTALDGTPESLETAAALGCDVVLMHMQGRPGTMQDNPRYDDVVAEVTAFLAGRARAAIMAGVAPGRIWLDPGFGFGKTTAHNLALLRGLEQIVALGYPVMVGGSRKGMIRALDPGATQATDRLGGSIAVALTAARAGAAMVRVHDVRATVQALTIAHAIHG